MHLTIVFLPLCAANYIQLILLFIYSACNRYNGNIYGTWIKFVISFNVKVNFLCDIYEINFVVFKKSNRRKCGQFGGKQYLIGYILRHISTAV